MPSDVTGSKGVGRTNGRRDRLRRRRLLPLASGVSAVTLICVLLGAGGDLTAQAQAGGGGTIEGRVVLTGPAPGNPPIRMGADPACGAINGGRRLTQPFIVRGSDNGLVNAFVEVEGKFAPTPAPRTPVTLDQQGCVFTPRVIGARVGQTVVVRNSDTTAHNVHSMSTVNPFNNSQPKQGMTFNYTLKAADTMLRVKCDIHSWMVAYIGVKEHPYFAVSDGGGAFRIENVPAGTYTLRSWHERLGPISQKVTVTRGATAKVTLSYSGSERPAPTAYRELDRRESFVLAGLENGGL